MDSDADGANATTEYESDLDAYSEVESIMASGADPAPQPRKRGRPKGSGGSRASVTPIGNPESSASSARGGRTATTPQALVRGVMQLLGLSTGALELVIGIPGVAMTEQEARDIAKPAARMLARTRWANLFIKQVASSSDAITLIFAVTMYGMRVYPLIAQRMADLEAQRQAARRAAVRSVPHGVQSPGQASGVRPAQAPESESGESGPINNINSGVRFDPGAIGGYGQYAAG